MPTLRRHVRRRRKNRGMAKQVWPWHPQFTRFRNGNKLAVRRTTTTCDLGYFECQQQPLQESRLLSILGLREPIPKQRRHRGIVVHGSRCSSVLLRSSTSLASLCVRMVLMGCRRTQPSTITSRVKPDTVMSPLLSSASRCRRWIVRRVIGDRTGERLRVPHRAPRVRGGLALV